MILILYPFDKEIYTFVINRVIYNLLYIMHNIYIFFLINKIIFDYVLWEHLLHKLYSIRI